MEKPIGIFDKNGHGYCINCGQDVMEEDFGSYIYDYTARPHHRPKEQNRSPSGP